MSNGGQFLFMLLVLAGVGVGMYVKHLRSVQRTAELAAYCKATGWRFSADDPYGLVNRWDGPPFDEGRKRRVRNVITTEVDGRAMVAFDFSHVVGYGKNSKTYEYGVVALGLPCRLPWLHVAPEHVLTRLGSMLGLEDIELESEEFNRMFRVRCGSPKFAHDILTPRTMQALLAAGPVEFRFAGTDAVCYELGYLGPGDLLARVAALRTVVDGIPSFVLRDRGVGA